MMAEGIAGTIEETTTRITAAARARGWRVEIYSRSEDGVVLYLAEPNVWWWGLVSIEADDSGRVSLARKRSGRAANAAVAIVTVLGLALSLLAIAGAILFAATWPGSVGWETFLSLGVFVAMLVALPIARTIWQRRPSRVRRNRELDLMVDTLTEQDRTEPDPAFL
ncbi:MAG: hypothetical protein QNJ81_15030 [Acidimicrobiia bacterium]|nr:hypothetical protein [Acidimicrobiia bacterium]